MVEYIKSKKRLSSTSNSTPDEHIPPLYRLIAARSPVEKAEVKIDESRILQSIESLRERVTILEAKNEQLEMTNAILKGIAKALKIELE